MGTVVSALGIYLSVKLDLPTGAAMVCTFGLVLILAILFLPNGVLGLLQKAWSKIRGRPRAPA